MTDFKLKQSTIDALGNFSTINNSILINAGNVLITMSESREIVARVELDDSFPEDIPLCDSMSNFLRAYSLFANPKIAFQGKHLKIKDGRNSQIIRYANPAIFGTDNKASVRIAKKDPKDVPLNIIASFNLSADDISNIKKSASIMGLSDFVIRNGENGVEAVCTNMNNSGSSNEYIIDVDDITGSIDKTVSIKISNMKLISGDYKVSISDDPVISKWECGSYQYLIGTLIGG